MTYQHDTDRFAILEVVDKAGLTGFGVEIGVDRGYFSREILNRTKLSRLYSVDVWMKDDIFFEAHAKLKNFSGRSVLMRSSSMICSQSFPHNFFDFVHIDADHSFEKVSKDLEYWWPKLKTGGIMSGHDYMPEWNSEPFGVIEAVNNFVQKHSQKLFVVGTNWKSWYFFKTGIKVTLL